MTRLRAAALMAAAFTLLQLAAAPLASPAQASPPTPFTNPVAQQRADPHIFKHTDGYYYFTATVPAYDRIVLRRATTLQGLAGAAEQTIWTKHASGEMGAHIWAPEIHYVNGKWYVYFAAGWSNDIWRIRMYVLENSSANPLTGSWVEKGRIATPNDTFALDATTFKHRGVRYLAWAQSEPGIATNSNLYLAAMSNPWTISGTPVRLSVPTLAWETRGYKVNEGPAIIKRNGRIFMSYSASATDANYCLGLLTASDTANLLSASSWTKGATPVRLRSHNQTTSYIRHWEYRAKLEANVANLADSQFRIVPGLTGSGTVSLESANFPGYYLRHKNFELWVERSDGSALFRNDATFYQRAGLAGSGISLESVNFAGRCMRHSGGLLYVQAVTSSAYGDATFQLE